MAQLIYDIASQTVGAAASGWTNHQPGASYTFNIASSGSDKYARLSIAGNATYPMLGYTAAGNQASGEILAKYRTNSNPSNLAFNLFTNLITANGNSWSSGVWNFPNARLEYANPNFDAAHADLGYAQTANTWYWIRFRNVGTTVQSKFWADGNAEPASWQLSVVDNTARVTGPMGFFGSNDVVAVNYDLAYFSVGTGTDYAPAPPTTTDKSQSGKLNITSPIPAAPSGGTYTGGFGGLMGWGVQGYAQALKPGITDVDKNQPGRLSIVLRQDKDQTGRLRIQQSYSQTTFGRLRIQKTLDQSTTGRLRIRQDYTKDQTGRLRIKKTIDVAQTGRLRIALTVPTTAIVDGWPGGVGSYIPGMQAPGGVLYPNVTFGVKNQTGVLRIQKNVSYDQGGLLRIQKTISVDQDGTLRIQKTIDQTQSGRLKVYILADRPQEGRLKIYRRVDEPITGIIRIQKTLDVDQNGKLTIVQVHASDQTGAISIYNPMITQGAYIPKFDTEGVFEQNTTQEGIFIPVDTQKGNF